MIYYLLYILIALTGLTVIYIKPGFIKMLGQSMVFNELALVRRILSYAAIIFCVLMSLYMLVLLAAGIFGIYILLTM